MKISIHAVHSAIADALFNRDVKAVIHKSIIVHISYSYDLCKFDVEVYGQRTSVLNIEIDGYFLYIHADKIHDNITKKLKIVQSEVADLLS